MKLKDDNKAQIIREKAIEMIVKEGFDGLSMHKLAKAANLSVSTIYLYFENREDLLNKLFIKVQANYSEVILKGFHPDLEFEKGLWLLWKNHLKFITQYPMQYNFHQQFSHSHLINNKDIVSDDFKKAVLKFGSNAIDKREIKKYKQEVLWSLAFGPFHQIVKFERDRSNVLNVPNNRLKQVFDAVMICLKS
jgi:TetR/AcrR family transcriptional regulator, multidrug resistance operon repressor